MGLLPFFTAASEAPIAWQSGRYISAEEFSADVAALIARLPQKRYLINLCDDRYNFLVGLAAALSCNQISLLPSNRAAQTLSQLNQRYEGTYCLTDGAEVPAEIERVEFVQQHAVGKGGFTVPAFAAEQVAVISFTSGSTGIPTPHPKTWGSLVKNAEISARRFVSEKFAQQRGILIGTVPHQHMYGLESTLMMPLQAGIAIHAGRPFYPADLREALALFEVPKLLITTPVHLRAYVNEGGAMPALDLIISATAPLPPALATEAERLFNAPVNEIYGCTEAGAIASRHTSESTTWRTYDGITIHSEGNQCVVEGGHLTAPVPLTDVIELRSPETFELRGRSSDLINIAGKRTSLADLNLQLGQIAGVLDGVFFMPDEVDGEVTRPMAFVVAPGLTSQAILSELRRRVDPVFLPRPLVLLDKLPRAETGKLPRARLVELAAHYAKGAAPSER